jgi:hypothetical protein
MKAYNVQAVEHDEVHRTYMVSCSSEAKTSSSSVRIVWSRNVPSVLTMHLGPSLPYIPNTASMTSFLGISGESTSHPKSATSRRLKAVVDHGSSCDRNNVTSRSEAEAVFIVKVVVFKSTNGRYENTVSLSLISPHFLLNVMSSTRR